MRPVRTIQIKAAFLFTVFAMNTLVGFACAIDLNMVFNSSHHEESEVKVHIHKDGKKHVHSDKHSHGNVTSHKKEGIKNHSENEKDNCCNKKVTEIGQLDKVVPQSVNLTHPVFFPAFSATFYEINLRLYEDIVKDPKPFVRGHHPPIPDIRIAIQSFLI